MACMYIRVGFDFDLSAVELVDDPFQLAGEFQEDAARFQQLFQDVLDGLAHAFRVETEEFAGVGGSHIDEVEVWRETCGDAHKRADSAASKGELRGYLEGLSIEQATNI